MPPATAGEAKTYACSCCLYTGLPVAASRTWNRLESEVTKYPLPPATAGEVITQLIWLLNRRDRDRPPVSSRRRGFEPSLPNARPQARRPGMTRRRQESVLRGA